MIELLLIGIGTGNPDHLTLQAIKALNGISSGPLFNARLHRAAA